jgi:DNA-binding transcriptional regulator LsrR (DeoR family)
MQSVKTRQQIADEYGIHRTTLNRWLKRANLIVANGLVCPRTQELIYATFGRPQQTSQASR